MEDREVPITQEELKRRTAWVLKKAESQLVIDGYVSPMFYFGKGEGTWLSRLRLEGIRQWMNDPHLKGFLFATVRLIVERVKFDCVISVTDTYFFEANEAGRALSMERLEELRDDKFAKLVKLGYGTVKEKVNVLGQTPEFVCMLSQPYRRDVFDPKKIDRLNKGKVSMQEIDRNGKDQGFKGKLDMFGEYEPRMREAYEQAKAAHEEADKSGLPDQLEVFMKAVVKVDTSK